MGNPLLEAREARWARRLELARGLGAGGSLLSLTLRLPAPLRVGREGAGLGQGLYAALRRASIDAGLGPGRGEFRLSADGPEGYLELDVGLAEAKELALGFEEGHPWGELADLDAMGPGGSVLGRAELGRRPRSCLVCGAEAAACVAGRSHGLEEIRRAAEVLLGGPLGPPGTRAASGAAAPELTLGPRGPWAGAMGESSRAIGEAALRALVAEAAAEPKPGLVSPSSRGAHLDMDYGSFLASAAALAPWFETFARLGRGFGGREPDELLPSLRAAGLEAERDMLAATGGVNTHKGLIFSLGLLCAASGLLAGRGERLEAGACARMAARIVRGICERDFAGLAGREAATLSSGERLRLGSGLGGARAEAEGGFPSVVGASLPRLRAGLSAGLGRGEALVDALLVLFGQVEDSNVLARCGPEGLELLRSSSARALGLGGMATEAGREAVAAMNEEFAARRLSPGGCADLLALTAFLAELPG
ncbi:MAG TPA: triphosphoribosyl-dephospho-CoA synthase [Spirochaetia bacterium]|nr:triphosphoribosyl-dephospho-CoA synthase [Spirochaetia bacterium]